MKNNKRKISTTWKEKVVFFILVTIVIITQSNDIFAASDPLGVINNLSNFIFGLIRAVGMIILGFGVVQVRNVIKIS